MASVDYQVTVEDQQKIVDFSLLYNKKLKLQQKLEALKQELGYLVDAQEESMIALETPLYKIGDCFLKLDESELEEELNKRKDKLDKDIQDLMDQLKQNQDASQGLKGVLYSKFGNRINLET